MTIIDLTLPLNENLPVYPGDPAPKLETVATVEQNGFRATSATLFTHSGTHVDAPSHMIAGGKALDAYPAERFVGRGRLIQLRNRQYDLAAVQAAGIEAGDIVLFQTGKQPTDADYFTDYPAIPEDVAQYLAEKKVSMVGVDACSVDHDEFTTHLFLLGADVLIVENLTNLQSLHEKDFTVYALPLTLPVDGAPARVIAHIH